MSLPGEGEGLLAVLGVHNSQAGVGQDAVGGEGSAVAIGAAVGNAAGHRAGQVQPVLLLAGEGLGEVGETGETTHNKQNSFLRVTPRDKSRTALKGAGAG